MTNVDKQAQLLQLQGSSLFSIILKNQQILLLIQRVTPRQVSELKTQQTQTHTGLVDMTPAVVVKGTLPFMQGNISLWLSTRHPASLGAAALDNACLSVSIHGILILFLCLEREGGIWGNRNTVNASLHGRLK